jgi:hypothetical protein
MQKPVSCSHATIASYKETTMQHLTIDTIRIDPDIGDGVAFTADIHGVAHRFFVSRETLGDIERTLLANNHDMLASFERQRGKVEKAILNVLRLGTSHNITFLKKAFFT